MSASFTLPVLYVYLNAPGKTTLQMTDTPGSGVVGHVAHRSTSDIAMSCLEAVL